LDRVLPRHPRPRLFPYTTLFRSPRVLDVRVEVLEDERQDHPAEEPGDAADDQVRRTLRARGRRRDLRAVDDVDVRGEERGDLGEDRKSTRLNSSHLGISYAVFCL